MITLWSFAFVTPIIRIIVYLSNNKEREYAKS
jgi:hypothetical protein